MKTKPLPTPLRNWWGLQALLLLLLTLLALPTFADPPTRVARVAELSGQAWWFDADEREWQPLVRNQSLAEGDRLRVDEHARVGLRIGSSALWLNERAQVELLRLDEERIDLALDRGALALRWVTTEAAREAVVRTQEGQFRFDGVGAYRIDQLSTASRAQAFEGRMRFEGRGRGDAPVWADAPEQIEVWWDGGPRAERSRLLRHDGFGQWLVADLGFGRGDDRFARLDRPAYRYVSPELTGADELDDHGRWDHSADYGAIWIPTRIAVDWAPYRHGRWTWSRHWGWTWVDDLPWGYATSHYGRWVHWRGRWCWSPGQRVLRPVFAPALVAWVGGGSVQVGVNIGSRWVPPVAWVPLAPREVFVPWYRHSPTYLQRINTEPVHTVRRPAEPNGGMGPHYTHQNRQVPGAISSLMVEAGQRAARPMPVRDEQVLRELKPIPYGPARVDGLPVRAAQSLEEGPSRRAGGGLVRSAGEAPMPQRGPEPVMPLRAEPREDAREVLRQPLPQRREELSRTEPGERREEPRTQSGLPQRESVWPRRELQREEVREERERVEAREERLPRRFEPAPIQRAEPSRPERIERVERFERPERPERREEPRFEPRQEVRPERREEPRRPEVQMPQRPQRSEPEAPRRQPEGRTRDKDESLPRRDNR
ncbi:hypothetical protein HNQ51_000978 [Inhella inkyongensis]|uniref:FecR protein domain-containing protein n=1 Tax=Inhella inkyongensis TaxID=392593 RepID=A0A840S0A6_9BURK|nr:DUF6600 domain-containing protein [Inhella inkyongensis]MBB5203685.1 hypothetical protein [Inhella inkyongensis]